MSESLTITESGVYHLTGALNNGGVVVDIRKDAVVKLILDNVFIKNPSGPAISCLDGDDLVIEVVGKNYLEDGSKYSAELDEDAKGTIYSKADLTFEGSGSLNIISNYQDGIIGKDDVKFKSGAYNITAIDDAIRGKDSVYIMGGVFNIVTSADGIKSTNEIDAGKGFVLIESGNFSIKSGAKGIKAINSILIYGGNFEIDSFDDSIHSNNYVGITGGNYEIISGDDGIHADRELIIDDGAINIRKSYEGLEAQAVTINGGSISVVTSDDGINAGGGVDKSSSNRPGSNTFNTNEEPRLTINGGDVYVNAAGDGMDSNGHIYFSGGKVVVDGPTNNGNGALDSELGIIMSGGEVIAVGSSGMAVNLGEKSNIYNISVYFGSSYSSKTNIKIKDSTGKTIIEHTSAKTFTHLSAGSDKFIPGAEYSIYIDDDKYDTFTISGVVTVIGDQSVNTRPGTNQAIPQRR